MKEADLKKHLKGELEKINKKPQSSKKDEKNEKDKNTITNQNLQEDNQLNDAVNVLKALIITKGN